MVRNYLVVYHALKTDEIKYKYFDTIENMKEFTKSLDKKHFKVLHKYGIKKVK